MVGSIGSSPAVIPSTASGSSAIEIRASIQVISKSGTVLRSNSDRTCLMRPTLFLPLREYPNQLKSSRTVNSVGLGAAPPSIAHFIPFDNSLSLSWTSISVRLPPILLKDNATRASFACPELEAVGILYTGRRCESTGLEGLLGMEPAFELRHEEVDSGFLRNQHGPSGHIRDENGVVSWHGRG